MIVGELNNHGYVVTEKMLRDRLKGWRVSKNSRKHHIPESVTVAANSDSVPHVAQEEFLTIAIKYEVLRRRCGVCSDESGSDTLGSPSTMGSSTLKASESPENGHRMLITCEACSSTLGSPSRPIRQPAERDYMHRTLKAVYSWYELGWETHHGVRWEVAECPMFKLMENYKQVIYSMRAGAEESGWKSLRAIGQEASAAMHSWHPASFIYILQFLAPWKSVADTKTRAVICTYFTRVAIKELGPSHPITLLSDAHAHEDQMWELSDLVVNIIHIKFIPRATRKGAYRNIIRLSNVYGWMLLEQHRHDDLVDTLEPILLHTEASGLTPSAKAEALRLLALSDVQQGKFPSADVRLDEAWSVLRDGEERLSKMASLVLEERARLFWRMGKLPACEAALYQALEIVRNGTDVAPWRSLYVLSFLDRVLFRQDKWEALQELRECRTEPCHRYEAAACLRQDSGYLAPIYCDECDNTIQEAVSYFHCGVCDGGDFDLCALCVGKGNTCEGKHRLLKRQVKQGKIVEQDAGNLCRL